MQCYKATNKHEYSRNKNNYVSAGIVKMRTQTRSACWILGWCHPLLIPTWDFARSVLLHTDCLSFCKWAHSFIIGSCKVVCNWQRDNNDGVTSVSAAAGVCDSQWGRTRLEAPDTPHFSLDPFLVLHRNPFGLSAEEKQN